MNPNIHYLIGLCLSAIIMIASIIWSAIRWIKRSKNNYILTGLRVLTIGTFIACLCFFTPYHYHNTFQFAGITSPFLASIHSTLQAFVLEFGFVEFIDHLPALYEWLKICYTVWVIILCIVAPILTLTNILSLFNAFINELRIKITLHKNLYVFSELNERSLAIAKSINDEYETTKKDKSAKEKMCKPMFIFTDCYPQENEPDQDKLQESKLLNAVCLKLDITHLKLSKRSCPIEFFIIGNDDSENMEQVIKLNDEYKDSPRRSIYLYSSKDTAGYILNSIDKGDKTITSRDFSQESARGFLTSRKDANNAYRPKEDYYYIRRVNVVNSFTAKVLTDDHLMNVLSRQAINDKTISIMIVGLGLYGTAFLKNILWLYQLKDCTLTLNVIESEDKETLQKRLSKEMPGLSDHFDSKGSDDSSLHYYSDQSGDCCFDIRIYHSIDCESSDLSNLILQKNHFAVSGTDNTETRDINDDAKPVTINKFNDIQAVFVSLGDDNKDIEAAVCLRGLFDSIKGVTNKTMKKGKKVSPLIYSIVYDNRTAKNMNCGSEGQTDSSNNSGILCYNNIPYHIHFIGRMSQHYRYDTIREMKRQEFSAIFYHVEWIRNESDLRDCFRTKAEDVSDKYAAKMLTDFQKEMQDYFNKESGGEESWNDASYYYTDKELAQLTAKGNALAFEKDRFKADAIADTVRSYDKFEYYRDSSVAKATYCSKIRDSGFKGYFDKYFRNTHHISEAPLSKICSCDRCLAFRESEHMRWNAYMIANGYRYDKNRNDRAKTHPNMKSWYELSVSDRYKD